MLLWWQLATRKEVIRRSLKTSLIVGTILAVINHGDALWALNVSFEHAMKMVLTYVVPYLVSTSASISAIRHHNNPQED